MRCFLILITLFVYTPFACSEGMFQYDRIDFFKEPDARKDIVSEPRRKNFESIESEWAEPVVNPSGEVTIYVPPKEVRDFLDKPDPENARAYLEWNLNRIRKFVTAKEMLAKEAETLNQPEEDNSAAGTDSHQVTSTNSASKDPVFQGNYLFFFMLKGCPVCEKEAPVIESIYLTHPEIRIQAFARGFGDDDLRKFMFPAIEDKGMSALFKIESYPTIVVFNSKRQKYFLSGLADKEKILKLFR